LVLSLAGTVSTGLVGSRAELHRLLKIRKVLVFAGQPAALISRWWQRYTQDDYALLSELVISHALTVADALSFQCRMARFDLVYTRHLHNANQVASYMSVAARVNPLTIECGNFREALQFIFNEAGLQLHDLSNINTYTHVAMSQQAAFMYQQRWEALRHRRAPSPRYMDQDDQQNDDDDDDDGGDVPPSFPLTQPR
jgi:hypothetical protein